MAPPSDPALAKLLVAELERHTAEVRRGEPALVKRALHAAKGSAALAGEIPLSEALARLERRLAANEPGVVADAVELLDDALAALREGRPALAPWPQPPAGLRPVPLLPDLAERYASEMRDRLDRLDQALAEHDDELAAVVAASREVHAMKGAALAAGDEPTAWFCHGLETRVRAGEASPAQAKRALDELSRWRGVLAEIVQSPDRALESLRFSSKTTRTSAPPVAPLPLPPRRPDAESEQPEPKSVASDGTLRVGTAVLDRLLDRVRELGRSRGDVLDRAAGVHGAAARARRLRGELAEALRLIGPARPWGAPVAAIRRIEASARELGGIAESLDAGATALRESAERVAAEESAARADLAAVRTTSASWLFDRVAGAVSAQARRDGEEVRLVTSGGDVPIDRRTAEALLDPVLQLARNALAHGIAAESAAERAMRGKARVGVVHLSAESRSGSLRVVVEDDGPGVEVSDLKSRAVAAGVITAEMARDADEQALLALLFLPGFTTRDSADLLAGRGVGLDLALEAVRRLGGRIHLASHAGRGVTATVVVPVERGFVKVLWVDAGGTTYALPVQAARRVVLARDAGPALPLAACLRRAAGKPARDVRQPSFVIDVEGAREGTRHALVGVDAVGAVEEVSVRPVSSLVAAAGPYAGAIWRGDSLRLCLDATALAELASRAA